MLKLNKLAGAILLTTLSTYSYATQYTIGGSSQEVPYTSNTTVAVPGSNFTMFSPVTNTTPPLTILANPDTPAEYGLLGTTEDITGTLDDALICYDVSCNDNAMTMSSVTPFSGAIWSAHDIRVFGPGTYSFNTCPNDGSTACDPADPASQATLEVGPGQVGAQVLFDWSGNVNIDVLLLWELDASIISQDRYSGLLPADNRTFHLASRDVDGDGNPGFAMTDGPFGGHNASFNLFLDQALAVPAKPAMTITQTGNTGASSGTIDPTGVNVTIDTGIAPASNLSFEWNVSNSPQYANGTAIYPPTDSALLAANSNGTTSETFVLDPSTIAPGSTLTASVRVTNSDNGLSNGATVDLTFGCPADSAPAGQDTDGDGTDDNMELCSDSDGDGILDYLDPSTLAANQTAIDLAGGTVATADSGTTLLLGNLAKSVADSNGNIGTGIAISSNDIGVDDSSVVQSCVGGCFDFVVNGGALAGSGTSVNVVVQLSSPIPERAVYKKFSGGAWNEFDASGDLDSVNSAASVSGTCPAPGDAAYSNGLVAGDDCLQISIEDDGPNDSDSTAGTVADPGGIAQQPAEQVFAAPKTRVEGALGCSATTTPVAPAERADWLILAAFIAMIGLIRKRPTVN